MDLLGGDATANAFLFAMSTVLVRAALDRAGPDGPVDAVLTELLNGIAADVADGTLDGGPVVPTGPELYALQATIDADAVMALLAVRLAEIGSTATVPDLHRVFDLDLDGVVDRDDPDADGDGHPRLTDGGDDCDDYDATVHPGATEDFGDGIDVDCTSDTDGDSFLSPEAGGDDCDDGDASIHPGAAEAWYDGVDGDCDGASDFDQDADGYDLVADCDDVDGAIHPAATETCGTAADDDCDGTPNTEDAVGCVPHHLDADGDGFGAPSSGVSRCLCFPEDAYVLGETDCDDADPARSPAALESCATPFDDDCDGDVVGDADGDQVADRPPPLGCVDFFLDGDGDGLGAGPPQCLCASDAMSLSGIDCDDGTASVGGPPSWYADGDGDGWGDAATAVVACDAPPGHVADATDCVDADPLQHPGAVWHRDADGDGYGDAGDAVAQCAWPSGYVVDATDCDDTDPDVNPGLTWYADLDGDGHGDPLAPTPCCDPSIPTSPAATDCDDTDPTRSPDAVESCDGDDDDCDGLVDDDPVWETWYADADGDGEGDPAVAVEACAPVPGHVSDDLIGTSRGSPSGPRR